MAFDRDEWERKLARLAYLVERRTLLRLIEALGTPPRFENVPASLWEGIREEYQKTIQAPFADIFLAQAQVLSGAASVGVSWTLTNEDAARWAKGYSFDLVKGMTDNLRAGLREAIPNFYTGGGTTGSLTEQLAQLVPDWEDRLGRMWGSQERAEMIAVTEVTRASEQAKDGVQEEIQRKNPAIGFDEFWETDKDEYVCPICRPLQGVQLKNGAYTHPNGTRYDAPPAHPRCRCRSRRVMVVRGKKAVELE